MLGKTDVEAKIFLVEVGKKRTVLDFKNNVDITKTCVTKFKIRSILFYWRKIYFYKR